jgi:hypothetical protein
MRQRAVTQISPGPWTYRGRGRSAARLALPRPRLRFDSSHLSWACTCAVMDRKPWSLRCRLGSSGTERPLARRILQPRSERLRSQSRLSKATVGSRAVFARSVATSCALVALVALGLAGESSAQTRLPTRVRDEATATVPAAAASRQAGRSSASRAGRTARRGCTPSGAACSGTTAPRRGGGFPRRRHRSLWICCTGAVRTRGSQEAPAACASWSVAPCPS